MPKSLTAVCTIAYLAILAAGVAAAQNTAEKLLVGNTKVQTIASYQGNSPLPKPERILVYDFIVPSSVIAVDESAAARLHRRRLQRRGLEADDSSEAIAQHVQTSFAEALVSELRKTSLPTRSISGDDTTVPTRALVVRGQFTSINQGDESRRVMVGFGRGASDVQAHVTVSLTGQTQPIMLSEFNLKSESGKKPGAAATMGVGSAAVGVVTGIAGDKKATVEGDASRMAKAVAQQVEQLMTAQHWISPPSPKAK